jgi:hypothetical protein
VGVPLPWPGDEPGAAAVIGPGVVGLLVSAWKVRLSAGIVSAYDPTVIGIGGWGPVTAGRRLSVVGALASMLALAACSPAATEALRVPGGMTDATATVPYLPAGHAATFGSIIVCAASADTPVTVTGVTLPQAVGGLAVTGFAVRPNPADTGGAPVGMAGEPLDSPLLAPLTPGPGPAAPCDGTGGSEVLVEVTRTADADGCAPGGLEIHYRAATGDAVLHIPLALGLGNTATPCG